MGQTLSEPITAKESASVQNARVKVGSSSMQGWRISMEDAHTHILKLNEDPEAMFFAVYDGHGGGKIAAHVSKNLHKHILRQPEYKQGAIEAALIKGFLDCDLAMRTEESLKDEMSGSTATTVLIKGNTLYASNAGDSRTVSSVGGRALCLTTDHKPGDERERKRIEDAGGFVEFNRVNGNLALSRALGDFAFKDNDDLPAEDQVVSGCPEVTVETIDDDWEFILLACDGIWDVLSNQEVVDFVTRRIASGLEPEDVCEELMTRCLATDCTMGGLGCDNMTVILVCFLNGNPYQKLVDKCTKLVKTRDAERLREREEEEAAAEAAEKASSSDENKENEDMDEGSAETPAKESDKPVSKLDGGSMSVEKMD